MTVICWTCGNVGVFDSSVAYGVRKPDRVEAREIAHDAYLQQAIKYWRDVHGGMIS